MKRIISLICCALLSVFAMGGCADNGEPFSPKTYTADSTQIKSISIDVRDRQIEVSPVPRITKFISTILKTTKSITTFPFRTKAC